jgi:epoxyqueuosine reductase
MPPRSVAATRRVPSVAELVALGRAQGLDAVGVAPAEPFTGTRRHLEERKAQGLHGGMAFTYRKPARSTDPGAALPDARALVVAARSYLRPHPSEAGDPTGAGHPGDAAGSGGAGYPGARDHDLGSVSEPGWDEQVWPDARGHGGGEARDPGAPSGGHRRPVGAVARYAWTDHYRALREGLQVVALSLKAEGWRARVLADDNALVDREAARRAGLGWYGKNANLLLPGQGSWFVLGSVVTDAPLVSEGPEPVADGCGSCRRCLDGCPTDAIVAPGVVDARRCLAWLLQVEGPFPHEHRVALGDRLYGCDDCQEVCPPNRRRSRRGADGADRADRASQGSGDEGEALEAEVDLLGLLAASDDELLDRHGRWYVPRRQARYLRRNALVVLGNVADPADPAVAVALRKALADDDPLVRGHAVWAVRRLGRTDLLDAVAGDDDPFVRHERDAPVEARR